MASFLMMMQDSTAAQRASEQVSADASAAWDTVDALVDGFLALLPKLVIALLVFLLFLFAARLARLAVQRATRGREKERTNAGQALGRLARACTILAGVFVAMSIVTPGVGLTELIGLLGAGGVAFAFALQDIFQNFVAGLLLLLRKPFRVGDQIVSNDYEGTVEAIETRSTVLKTYDGRRVVIPNGEIYTTPTEVNTAYPMRRREYDVGIGYGDDIGTAAEAMQQAMEGVDGVLADPPPEVLVVDLAGASVNLRARWWTRPQQADVLNASSRVIRALKEALDAAGVDMPYPTQVTLLHDQTEATDGDRTRQREGWPAGADPPEAQTAAAALHRIAKGGS